MLQAASSTMMVAAPPRRQGPPISTAQCTARRSSGRLIPFRFNNSARSSVIQVPLMTAARFTSSRDAPAAHGQRTTIRTAALADVASLTGGMSAFRSTALAVVRDGGAAVQRTLASIPLAARTWLMVLAALGLFWVQQMRLRRAASGARRLEEEKQDLARTVAEKVRTSVVACLLLCRACRLFVQQLCSGACWNRRCAG